MGVNLTGGGTVCSLNHAHPIYYFHRYKRGGGGCWYFGGCAQLVIGQNAVRNMIHNNRASVFSSPYGPGRRKRSVSSGDVLPMSSNDFRLLADDVELYKDILGQITTANSKQ